MLKPRPLMTEGEKQEEWVRFVNSAVEGYLPWALVAVYESDGEKMLAKVIQRLDLDLPKLVRRLSERGREVGATEVDSAGRARKSPETPPRVEPTFSDKAPWE